MDVTFAFDAELYRWEARDDASWVFVTLPVELAEDIRELDLPRRGFGSVKVRVRLGPAEWRTSIFPDAQSGSYVLPLKKAARAAAGVDVGDIAGFEIDVAPE